ncbi:trichohyalin-like [Cydia splendana]|uniref:trichohyalin-like n=1 Tax=Cydia splendana TaxID=1100963 RepID=UPI00300C56D1
MRPASGRQKCDCCRNYGKAEFKKIIEFKDSGIALYRYWPQTEDEAQIGTETGEVLILRNTRDVDLKIEELTAEAGKKTISCPRCIKMIERAKCLFTDLPPDKIREVAGVCDHCYQKDFFPCPYCDKVVNKFLKFILEEERKTQECRQQYKAWLSKTRRSFKKSVTNIKDGKLESQAPVSRYIPTMMPQQKQIEEEPTRVLSFLEFSEEEKLRVEGESELDMEKKKRLAEENVAKALKSVSFDAFSKTDLEPTLIKVRDIKVISPIEKDKPSTPIMDELIKSQPTMEQDIETTTVMQKIIRPKLEIEKYSKPTQLTKKYTKHQSMMEKEVKLKSIMKKGSVKKPPHDVFPKDDRTPQGKRKLQSSPTTIPSFETIMKTLSEPNVSNFRYIFPRGKIVTTKQLKGCVSSSELIKTTQDMLDELKETERKRKEDTRRKREEEKKQKTAEKTRLLKEESEKREEGRLLEEERKKHQEGRDIKYEESIGKVSEQLARRRKQDGTEVINARKEGLSEQEKELSQAGKIREQLEKDTALGDKKAREAEKAIEGMREDKLRKQIDQGQEKNKQRGEMQRDAKATTALKEQMAKQAKDKSEEEKLRKQQEKDEALKEKKAKEADKQLTSEKLTIDKKTTHPEAKSGEDEDRIGKGQKEKTIYQGQEKNKQRGEMQRDAKATTALKEQMAKQAKDKSEEEKLRKQQEKDEALKEKKAKEADKVLESTHKQLTTEKKQGATKRLSELKVHDKDDTGKAEKTTAKDQKAKGADMAVLLREELAKQKQLELEKEKIRKQQEKERELLAKKLKELESSKEAKKAAIKAPVLEPEDSVDEISTDFTMLPKQDEVTDIIIGQKIYNVKCAKKTEDDKTPILELEQSQKQGQHSEQITAKQEPELHKPEPQERFTKQKPGPQTPTQSQKKATDSEAKGVIRYTLSDRTFIEKGWTMLPTEKVVRKMNVYRMRPAKPEFDWFEHNKNKGLLTYDSGEKLAEFDDDGHGRWYYRTGKLALDYYDAEETNAGQRFVVYSTGQPDERGRSRPRTLLATFDYSGNGIVFDHTGKIRLKYNQTEGVVLDRTIGPVSHWKWHTLNDPPVLQQVMIDTQMPYKDPTILAMGDKQADAKRPDNEEMLAIEFENFLKEKRQKITQSQSFKPFQIKMKALKINENFSLRVLDQASIYLFFRDGTTNLKLNIGMVLDHKEIVDTDTAEIGEVSNTLDKLPACTDSIAELQKAVAKAQAQERLRVRHELRLKPPQPSESADALRTGCSRPLRTPVVQASLSSRDKMTPKRFKPSSSCNLYYSTQLF